MVRSCSLWSGTFFVAFALLAAAPPASDPEQAPPADATVRPRFPMPVPHVDPRTLPADFSIAGRWYSDFGYLDLEQEGRAFTGTYSCCGGTIEGTVSSGKIDFSWKDPLYGEGWGYFQPRESLHRMVGVWGNKDDFGSAGQWNAVRIDEPALTGSVTRYRVETEHPQFGRFHGVALVGVDGAVVHGKLQGFFETTAKERTYREEVFFLLEGEVDPQAGLVLEWEDPRHKELGGLELSLAGEQWVGTWEAHRSSQRVAMTWTRAAVRDPSAP